MARIIILFAVVYAVLLLLRLFNSKKPAQRPPGRSATPAVERMVRCERCGVFVPRSEALEINGSLRCRDSRCAPGR